MDPRPIRDLYPNLGDRVFLQEKGVECTIIAHDPKDNTHPYLLGFDKAAAIKAGVRDSVLNGGPADPRSMPWSHHVSDLFQYVFSEWILGGALCALINSQGGMKCAGKSCGTFVQYATPNQKDGSFLCYPCRQRPRYMTQTTKE